MAAQNTPFRFISCKVEPGMFRGEWLVHIDVRDPKTPGRTIPAQLLVDERQFILQGAGRQSAASQ